MEGMPAGAAARDAMDTGAELAAVLAAGGAGLRLDLQPICAASSLAPVGYEALLRWEHPLLGAVPASVALAAAEAAGRSLALDAWALVNAFRMRAGWPATGPYLAVNLSAPVILAGHAAPMIRAALDATGAEARGILVELPEAAVARDTAAAQDLAAALRALGMTVALDDFGGTHGSARILRDIAFAAVKIDPALSRGLDGEGPGAIRARAMVGAVVDMAHAMGATTIAEAVETTVQLKWLRDAGCDALQGWLLGRPGPAA